MALKNTFLILCFSLFFVSCEKDAEIKLPEVPKRMAVNCYISPGDSIMAWVMEVKPLYGGQVSFDPDFINNATVIISNGNDSVTLVLDPATQNFYYKNGPGLVIEKGKTYYLYVHAPGFPSLKSSCTVPSDNVTDFQNPLSMVPEGSDTLTTIFYTWDDIPGQENFYRISSSIIDSFESQGQYFTQEYEFYFNQSMYEDAGSDGARISSGKGEMTLGAQQVYSRFIRSHLITCDKNYFLYHRSLDNYSGDNPFGEPSQLYSNVEGGLGVFGAYIQYTRFFRVF